MAHDDGGASVRATREKELARLDKTTGVLAGEFELRVVGVTFVPGYPGNLHSLEMLNIEAEARGERLTALLMHNPDNAYDTNAIEVHVPSVGMVGHAPAPLAKRLAPLLDAGEVWQGEVVAVLISEENINRPGITIHCKRIN